MLVLAALALGHTSAAVGYPCDAVPPLQALTLPNGSGITNSFDSLARLTATALTNSGQALLNLHGYDYDLLDRRTNQVFLAGNALAYGYDAISQLETAVGFEADASPRFHEQFTYYYDAANNLQTRIKNQLVQTFYPDDRNQLSSVVRSGTYTLSGWTESLPSWRVQTVQLNDASAGFRSYADKTYAVTNVTLANGWNHFTNVVHWKEGSLGATNTVNAYLPAAVSFQYDANGNLTNDGLDIDHSAVGRICWE